MTTATATSADAMLGETAVAPTAAPPAAPRGLGHRIAGQGALLLSGFALSQALSFLRNAIIAYTLSKGDFGIAATLTLALQMLETLSDLGADRLIVQAKDGEDPALMAAAHSVLVLRGLLTGAILFLSAGAVARVFAIEHARHAFELAALVPVIKGFVHLDQRRQQRQLRNGASMIVEVVPQLVVVLATWPLLKWWPSFEPVVWLALGQAVVTLIASHAVAERSWRFGFDRRLLVRLLTFGWPIWLSAFPLLAVFQADRVIVGSMHGVEALAGYTAAFMVTMVPGLIAAKIGHALMLPVFSEARADSALFLKRLTLASEATSVLAAMYLVVFAVAGGAVLPLAFGPNYTGLSDLVTCLALMWTIRMVQTVPGMALMSGGETQPLLIAGLVRTISLPLALAANAMGFGVLGVAAAGVLGELASLVYVAWRAERTCTGIAWLFVSRLLLLVVAAGASALVIEFLPAGAGYALAFPAAVVTAVCVAFIGLAAMAAIRARAAADLDQPDASPAA